MRFVHWILLVNFLGSASGLPKLKCKDRQEIDPKNRRCRKACRSNNDCVSQRKTCLCDGACGFSCINQNTRCSPDLVTFANGTVRLIPENKFGAVAQYICNDGFVLRGPEARVCQGDEHWSQHEPICILDNTMKINECGYPPRVLNAQHDGSPRQVSFPVHNKLEYRCKPGYTLSLDSAPRAWCVSDGVWVGPTMTCIPIPGSMGCPLLETIENGLVDVDPSSSVGSVARYHCMTGFNLAGRTERTCGSDGTWEGVPPSCEKVTCGEPPEVDHSRHDGYKVNTLYPSGHQLEYTCQVGYYPDGDDRAMCSGQGLWIGLTFTCFPRNCGFPGDIENGWRAGYSFTYPNTVTYFCYDGFELRGNKYRTCQASGMWDNAVPPYCEASTCPPLQDPSFGTKSTPDTKYGTEIEFVCYQDYRLKGSDTRRCQADRTWSGEPTTCEEIDCGWPRHFYNGYLTGDRTTVGATILFVCAIRTNSDGSAFHTVCQDNGHWSNSPPICWGQCKIPQIVNATLVEGRHMDYVTHGTNVNFRCAKGLQPKGGTSVHCNNGTWSLQPQCDPAPCISYPPPIYNGFRIFLGRTHGSKAKYKCFPGYRLKGMNSSFLYCNYGNWVGGSPVCEEFFCPSPGTLKNGLVYKKVEEARFTFQPYIRSIRHGDRLEYECNKGFRLSGPSGATCVDGQWRPTLNDPGTKCIEIVHPPFSKLWTPVQEQDL